MKIFDWKKREAFDKLVIPDDYQLGPTTLFPIPGSRQRFQRVGRGISAGQGKTCGKGMRGQKSRKGPGVRPGFEGGQTPLYRRLPKFVGKPMRSHVKKKFSLIKLHHLNAVEDGAEVDYAALLAIGVVTKCKPSRRIYKVPPLSPCTIPSYHTLIPLIISPYLPLSDALSSHLTYMAM